MQQPPASDVAFTRRQGRPSPARLREGFARMEERGGWRTRITPELAEFLARARSFYLATASVEGQP
jgi:hypothetical protein